eukprot:361083-Pleurochrysis_carterae.AAC.1
MREVARSSSGVSVAVPLCCAEEPAVAALGVRGAVESGAISVVLGPWRRELSRLQAARCDREAS